MRKLWLHIGSHKTGTTTLQRSLIAAKRRGTLTGWTYVHADNLANLNNAICIKGSGPEMKWHVRPEAIKSQIPDDGDCIISGERFFWLNDEDEIRRLANTLTEKFTHIKIVVYLRRQESLALSFRKTAITMQPARQFFGDGVSALPKYQPHMDSYFDYSRKIALWEDAFGAENIIVRRYGDSDTVEDFSKVIGVDLPAITRKINKSWSRNQMMAALWLQSRGYGYKEFSAVVDSIEDTEKLLPSRQESENFVKRFDKSNAVLAEKYGGNGDGRYFDENFSMYPVVGNDDLSALSINLGRIESRVKGQTVVQYWQEKGLSKLSSLVKKIARASPLRHLSK